VLAVQQLESHVLQPFLLGRAVNVHPLAVILSVTTGVVVAGVFGALIAVPVTAVVNAVGSHLRALREQAAGEEAPESGHGSRAPVEPREPIEPDPSAGDA